MPELVRTPPGGGPEGLESSAYEERIAQLERVIAEKEHAVLRAVLSSSEVQQQLETSRAETRALAAQLELARERPTSAALGEEISRMSAQFAQARKGLDRERMQTQAEGVAVKARFQQAKRDLEHERQMRHADGAAYNAKIAALQRDLAGAQAQQPTPPPTRSPRTVWAWLAVCALSGAVLVCVYVAWLRFSTVTGTSVARGRHAGPESSRLPVITEQRFTRPALPQKGPEVTAEELKRRLERIDPSLCDFQWTGGLPTILYRGKDSLTSILSRCTQVDDTRAQRPKDGKN